MCSIHLPLMQHMDGQHEPLPDMLPRCDHVSMYRDQWHRPSGCSGLAATALLFSLSEGAGGARLHGCGAGGHRVLRQAGKHAVLHAAVQAREAAQRALHWRVPCRARVRRALALRAQAPGAVSCNKGVLCCLPLC